MMDIQFLNRRHKVLESRTVVASDGKLLRVRSAGGATNLCET